MQKVVSRSISISSSRSSTPKRATEERTHLIADPSASYPELSGKVKVANGGKEPIEDLLLLLRQLDGVPHVYSRRSRSRRHSPATRGQEYWISALETTCSSRTETSTREVESRKRRVVEESERRRKQKNMAIYSSHCRGRGKRSIGWRETRFFY